jgi:putative DNA primase/helicase
LARFLVAWPESTQGKRRFSESPEHWPMLERYRSRVKELLNLPQQVEDGCVNPAMLHLTPEAKTVWIAFHDEIEVQLNVDGELHEVRDVASKIADNAARLAALFHAIEGVADGVSEYHMASACRVAHWHLNESRRLLAQADTYAEDDVTKMDRWLRNKFTEIAVKEMAFSEIQKLGPAALRKKEALEPVLQALSELGRLRVIPGQPRLVKLNPALLE